MNGWKNLYSCSIFFPRARSSCATFDRRSSRYCTDLQRVKAYIYIALVISWTSGVLLFAWCNRGTYNAVIHNWSAGVTFQKQIYASYTQIVKVYCSKMLEDTNLLRNLIATPDCRAAKYFHGPWRISNSSLPNRMTCFYLFSYDFHASFLIIS